MNLLNSKVAKVLAVSTAVAGISIAGVAYNSNKEAILNQISQLKKKAHDWQAQAGDNKYELQQASQKYSSVISILKDKLGLNLEDGATVEEIASALETYVGDANSKTDVNTYNTAISAIATSLGLELTDKKKNEQGMYNYELITSELAKLDQAITDLETALKEGEVIDKTGNTVGDINGSIVDKINYLINQIQTANNDQNDILAVATSANNSIEASNADFIKLNYRLSEASDVDQYKILDVFNNSNLYGPVTTPIDIVIKGGRTQEVHIADPVAYEYTTKYAPEVDEPDANGVGIYKREGDGAYFVVFKGAGNTNIQYKILNK